MSDEGVVVGRVSIKVYPDLDPFERGLKVEVTKAEKKHRVDIPVHADADELGHEVRHASRVAQARAKKIEIPVSLDRDQIDDSIRRINRHLKELDTVTIGVDYDKKSLENFKQELEGFKDSTKYKIEIIDDLDGIRAARDRIAQELRQRGAYTVEIDADDESLRRMKNKLDKHIADLTPKEKIRFDFEADDAGLRRNLEKVERALGELRAPPIEVDVDEESLVRARNQLHRMIKDRPIELEYEDNADGLRRVLAEIDAKIAAQNLKKLKIENDPEGLRKARQEIKDLIDDYDGKNIELDVEAQSLKAKAELARVARDRRVNLFVSINKAALAKAQATLAALAGGRLISSTLENMWDLFKNMDKNIPLIGSIALAVQGLTAWLLAASSNTFSLVRGLGELTGFGLTLPGILGGFTVGIGATIAVLRDFNNELPMVKQRLGDLRTAMSKRFWAVARNPIKDAFDSLMPEFESGIKKTSTALGVWFSEMASGMERHLRGSLSGMFAELNRSILIAAEGADDFAASLEILGRRGAEYLPRLATWFRDTIGSLRSWLDEAERTGRLNQIIETGITNLVAFGNIIRHTGGIIAGLGRAADRAGGVSLTGLAEKLERIHETVDKPVFQNNLTKALKAAHDAMDRISTESGPRVTRFFERFTDVLVAALPSVGDAIGKLVGGIAEAFSTDKFERGLVDMFKGLDDAISSLNTMWAPLGDGLGSVMSLLGTFASSFGPILEKVMTTLSNIATSVGPLIESMVKSLSGRLLTLLELVAPAIERLSVVLVRLVEPLVRMPGLVEAFAVSLAMVKVGKLVEGLSVVKAMFTTSLAENIVTAGVAMEAMGGKAAIAGGKLTGAFGGGAGAAKVARFLGPAGIVVGVLAAEDAFQRWVNTLGVVTPSVHELADAVARLDTEAGRLDLNAALGGEDSKWSEWFDKAPGLFGPVINGFSKLGSVVGLETAPALRGAATDVDDLSTAFDMLQRWDAGGFFQKVWGFDEVFAGGFRMTPATKQAEEAVLSLDEAFANAIRSGGAEEVANIHAYLAAEAKKSGVTITELRDRLPEYSAALSEAEAAAREQAAEVARAAEQTAKFEKATEAATGMMPSQIASLNESSKAMFNLGQDIADTEMHYRDWIQSLKDQVAAQAEWATNIATLARKGVSEGVIAELEKLPEGAQMVAQLVDASAEEIAELNEVFATGTAGAAASAGSGFADINARALAELEKLPPEVLAELGDLPELLRQAGVDSAEGLAGGLGSGFDSASDAARELANGVDKAYSEKMQIRSPSKLMNTRGKETVAGLVRGISDSDSDAKTAMDGIADTVKSIWDGAKDFLPEKGRNLVDGLIGGIGSRNTHAKTSSDVVKRNVTSPFDNSISFLRSPGTNLVSGLISAINAKRGDAKSSSTNVRESVKSPFGSAKSLLSSAGGQIVSGLRSAINNARASVRAAATSTRSAISGVFANVGGLLVGAGSRIMNGLISGIRSKVGAVKSLLQGVTASLPSWKGPAAVDRVLLYRPGQLIMDGLLDGLESRFGAVRKLMADLTSEIGDTEIGAPKVAAPSVARASYAGMAEGQPGRGSVAITVNADVSSLAELQSLGEFLRMAEVWEAQGLGA